MYEISLVSSNSKYVDPLRYSQSLSKEAPHKNELALLRLRYKQPDSSTSKLIERPIMTADIESKLDKTSERFRFSASVAGFGQLLRGGKYTADYHYDDVLELARNARGNDAFGYRGEFISLVNLAKSLETNRIKG
jgi:Ca-activated chloride channel family protein